MSGLLNHSKFRMEMISFQMNDDFGPQLEEIISAIYSKIEKNNYESFEVQKLPQVQELQKAIQDRLGMKTFIITDSPNIAAIIPFHLGESAILKGNDFIRANWFTNEQKDLRLATEGKKAWVDEDKVRMGGVYSDYTNSLFMNFNMLHSYGLTAREVTAVLLHELGHGFYACAYSNRMDRANQIISEALRNKETDKTKYTETTFSKLKEKGVNVKKEIVEGLTSENPIIFCQSSLTLVSECIMTQMASGKSDETSFEQLADNFAARFGYGRDLVTGLEKFYPGGVRNYRTFMTIITTMQTISIIFVFLNSIRIIRVVMQTGDYLRNIIPFAQAIYYILFCVLFAYVSIRTAGEDGRDFTYDDLHKRYNRIRLQVIEMIKTKQLNKVQADEAVKTVEFIAELIDGVKPYRGPLDFLFNAFNPKDRRAKNSIARQQAIEDLMGNNLFVASLKAQMAIKN